MKGKCGCDFDKEIYCHNHWLDLLIYGNAIIDTKELIDQFYFRHKPSHSWQSMAQSWHDLYTHGQRLEYVCKQMNSKFKQAIKEGNDDMARVYAESLRRITMDTVAIAKVVLGVEEVIKKKRIDKATI